MLEKLGNALKSAINKIASAIFVDKKLIDEIIKELQKALIEADVNVQLVFQISEELKKAAASEKIKGIEKKEHIIKILNDKIIEILGGEKKELQLGKKSKIMLLGLYGSGKTTSIAKIAAYYSKRGRKVAAVGLDVHRPAAPEQLEQVCKPLNIPCFIDKQEKSPEKIWKKYEKELEKYDLVLIDTAGRDALSKELISEIKEIEKLIKPDEILLVMPADIGQAARTQASEFKKACKITGTIITRMDSSAKGGGALTSCYETKAPVYFLGTGEKSQDIEPFNPSSFVSRLLGMGDLETLVEKVKSATTEKEQKKLKARLEQGKFTMDDLYEQLKSMQSLGPLGKIAQLIPGFGKAKIPEEMLDLQEEKLKKWKFAIDSMTRDEKENPEIIEKQTSRISRIAKGAGTNTSDVRALLKQYKIIKEFAKTGQGLEISEGLSQKQLQKLAKKFGKRIRI